MMWPQGTRSFRMCASDGGGSQSASKVASASGGWLLEHSPTAADWRSLRRALDADHHFLASSWFETWSESFLPERNWHGPVRYITFRASDGNLLGALPYARYRSSYAFSFICGAGYYWPFRGLPIGADPTTLEGICDGLTELLSRVSPLQLGLRLGPVCEGDAALAGVLAGLRRRGWHVGSKRLGDNFELVLPDSVDAFCDSRRRLIERVRYYERRAAKDGVLKIERCSVSRGSSWELVLESLAAVERGSWLAKGGDQKFHGPKNLRFWRRLVEEEFFSDNLSAWILYIDGRPVSFSFNMDCGDIKYILANNYVENVRTYSTGWIVAYHMFCDAIAHNIKRVDWGQGDSGYKQRWGAQPGKALSDCIALPPGPKGWLLSRLLTTLNNYEFTK